MRCPSCKSTAVIEVAGAVVTTAEGNVFDGWHCDECSADFDVLRGCQP